MEIKNNLLESIITYSKKQNISLDIEAFSFRLASHPGYPNLLSVIETLAYFHIQCDVYNVSFEEIDQTPDRYLVFLKAKYGRQDLHLIEKKNDHIYLDSNKVSLAYLKPRWKGIVLLLDQDEDKKIINKTSNNTIRNGFFILILLSVLSLVLLQTNASKSLFSLLSVFGFLVSILSLKGVFKLNTNHFDKFCNHAVQYDCDTVINSKKWKLFQRINFSDSSFLFFISQIISYLIMSVASYESDYFFYQNVALAFSIPFVIISLYYQKFVEKKWCPLCLAISTILTTQFLILTYTVKTSTSLSLEPILLFGLIQVIIVFSWFRIKNILVQLNNLKETKIENTRLLRNYTLFRNTLIEQKRYDLQFGLLSKKHTTNEQLTITLITNPFCDYCKKAHISIQKIVARYGDRIMHNTILNVDIHDEYDNDKLICQNLMAMQLRGEKEKFAAALDVWFMNENESKWLTTYTSELDELTVEQAFVNQKKWCIQNQIDFTPGLFINGYFYPQIYAIDHLDYFIQDLLSDTEILKNTNELAMY